MIPGFNAEASLNRTRERYRKSGNMIGSLIEMREVIHPTMSIAHGITCSPGFLQLGWGENMVCIPDPSWAGGGPTREPEVPIGPMPGGPGGGVGFTNCISIRCGSKRGAEFERCRRECLRRHPR